MGEDHTRIDSHRMWGELLGKEEGTDAMRRRPRGMEAGAERKKEHILPSSNKREALPPLLPGYYFYI